MDYVNVTNNTGTRLVAVGTHANATPIALAPGASASVAYYGANEVRVYKQPGEVIVPGESIEGALTITENEAGELQAGT